MFIYRLIYAASLAIAVIFYLVYTPWFSWYLLVVMLLLIPLDLLVSLPGMLTKSVKIEAPVCLDQNASGVLIITAVNTGLPCLNLRLFSRAKDNTQDDLLPEKRDLYTSESTSKRSFPVRCLYIRLRVIGDDFIIQYNTLNAGGDGNRSETKIGTSRTGLSVIKVHRLYTVSLLGLFSLPVKVNAKTSVLVLPPPKKPKSTVELPRGLVLVPKPGGGFSEEHDVRGYLPGDPIKSIHWKLSAKLDSPIIREPLIPPQQSRLVHIMPWENAAERDSVLAHLRWVSGYLIKMGLQFYVRFGDRHLIEEITDKADLINFLRRVLDNSTVIKNIQHPRITRFSWVYKVSGDTTAPNESGGGK